MNETKSYFTYIFIIQNNRTKACAAIHCSYFNVDFYVEMKNSKTIYRNFRKKNKNLYF